MPAFLAGVSARAEVKFQPDAKVGASRLAADMQAMAATSSYKLMSYLELSCRKENDATCYNLSLKSHTQSGPQTA